MAKEVGVPEFESGTSSLSATRSNQLSYTTDLTLVIDARITACIDRVGCLNAGVLRETAEFTRTPLAIQGNLPLTNAVFFQQVT